MQSPQLINGEQNSELRYIPTLSLGSTYSINSNTALVLVLVVALLLLILSLGLVCGRNFSFQAFSLLKENLNFLENKF